MGLFGLLREVLRLKKNNVWSKNSPFNINEDSNSGTFDEVYDSIFNPNGSPSKSPFEKESIENKYEELLKIDKTLNFTDKFTLMIETYELGFEPRISLKNVSSRIGKIRLERIGDFTYKYVKSSEAKVYINTDEYDVEEVIESINIEGNPDLNFGLGSSMFVRTEMFKIALAIVGSDNSIKIFRNDFGYQRVEYTQDDLKSYIARH